MPHNPPSLCIGTAGWALPREVQHVFPGDGAHLERYARVLHCTEINTTFSRTHRPDTFERWAAQTPDRFRFSVKMPKAFTHAARLDVPRAEVRAFVSSLEGLGERLGVLLMQLPPSLVFDGTVARAFFRSVRAGFPGAVVCEPRHASWYTAPASALLVHERIGRVAADPPKPAEAAEPGGWLGEHGDGRGAVVYYRWHGSPRMYWSAYGDAWLADKARALAHWPATTRVWCIFDNTASGAAADDALRLAAHMGLR
ncbi:DUF72 domain-containing protein [Hydrogenophaga sp.]|uniref:DUF72 domain-containing protein n=1 Tax=Hydrogenophaga sp. TaxID=1904254 RepID=UPI002725657D|nr:DUF72 domain-containing protein [Hydrogenophaga sp.]MDO9434164.1 DUF72 domain-containing protein [Hydrogenophaga sp.]